MEFSESDKTKILKLKSNVASYYSLQMKKISDRQLESLFFDDCIITGGCISSIFHSEAVKDIDLYAKNHIAILKIKNHILNSSAENIKTVSLYTLDEVIDDKDPKPLITENAITLNNDVQFIHLGDAEQCRSKFDFIHCMPWYDIKKQKLYISKEQFDSIQKKDLVVNRAYFGEVKQNRLDKYISKGWKWEPKQTTLIA
jgi:hypothetical protein